MKKNKFNQIYKNIINEDFHPFSKQDGDEDLPKEYLINFPQIKQCLLTNHLGIERSNEEGFNYNSVSKEIIFKNIQLFLKAIFENKNLLNKINRNEYRNKSFECLCSTTHKFNGKENSHLCIVMNVNSRSHGDGTIEYYFLCKTIYTKTQKEYKIFVKQKYKSTKHPNQEPVLIIGENIEKTE